MAIPQQGLLRDQYHLSQNEGDVERMAIRQNFVLEARLAGFTPQQCLALWNKKQEAQGTPEFAVSIVTIKADLRAIFDRIAREDTINRDAMRALLDMRYESMWRSIQKQVTSGNLRAVEVGIKINKAVAELHGLTQTIHLEQTNITNTINLSPEERESRIQELIQKATDRALYEQASGIIDVSPGGDEESPDALAAE